MKAGTVETVASDQLGRDAMMLLDTNVISELVRAAPAPAALAYVESLAPDSVFTAAICEAEIRHGVARLPPGRRRDELATRIAAFLDAGFPGRCCRSTASARPSTARCGRGGRPPATRSRSRTP